MISAARGSGKRRRSRRRRRGRLFRLVGDALFFSVSWRGRVID